MSESYTVGGDALQPLGWDNYAGQTFTPLETHVLQFIDLDLTTIHPNRMASIDVYLADASHFPTGDSLSRNIRSVTRMARRNNVECIRFKMNAYPLEEGTEYVIVVHAFAMDKPYYMRWQYDSGNAVYPRGVRILSTDGGSSWQVKAGQDHIFAESGLPPQPPAPPDPPVDKWAVIDVNYIRTADGVQVLCTTNSPCHLWMRWSLEPPDIHLDPVLTRGTVVGTRPRYCFDVYHDNEQEEEGDTLYHSFIKEPWADCETRWFYFWGRVRGADTDSESAIFKYHREAPIIICTSNLTGDDNGWLYKYQQRAQSFIPPSDIRARYLEVALKHYATPHLIGIYIQLQATTAEHLPNGVVLSSGYILLPETMPLVWTIFGTGLTDYLFTEGTEYMWIMKPNPWQSGYPYDEVHVAEGEDFSCGWPAYQAYRDIGEAWQLSPPSDKRTFTRLYVAQA